MSEDEFYVAERLETDCGLGHVERIAALTAERDEWKRRAEEAEALIPVAERYKAMLVERDALAVQNDALREALREWNTDDPPLGLTIPRATRIAEARKQFTRAVRNGVGRICYQCAKNSGDRPAAMKEADASEREYERVDTELRKLESENEAV